MLLLFTALAGSVALGFAVWRLILAPYLALRELRKQGIETMPFVPIIGNVRRASPRGSRLPRGHPLPQLLSLRALGEGPNVYHQVRDAIRRGDTRAFHSAPKHGPTGHRCISASSRPRRESRDLASLGVPAGGAHLSRRRRPRPTCSCMARSSPCKPLTWTSSVMFASRSKVPSSRIE